MLAARVKSLIEQLLQDEEDWKEIRERFEQGSRRGAYPAILEGWSCIPDEEKDMFLKVFGMEAMRCLAPPKKQPWDEPSFDGHMDSYRNELYEGTAYLYHDELQEFAQELARVGDESPTSWLGAGVFFMH